MDIHKRRKRLPWSSLLVSGFLSYGNVSSLNSSGQKNDLHPSPALATLSSQCRNRDTDIKMALWTQ